MYQNNRYEIRQVSLTSEIQKQIRIDFNTHACKSGGHSCLVEEAVVFEIYKDNIKVGYTSIEVFLGQLHVRSLFVLEGYRGIGIGTKLMHRSLEFAKKQGCDFVFLETMNFQAPIFYQKLGFEIEFTRHGFNNGSVMHYLKKKL